MSTWICIGSGPSAPRALPDVLASNVGAKTITTNAGIDIYPSPDVYVLIDMNASIIFQTHAIEAQRGGTRMVTLRRHAAALRSRRVDWFDEFVSVPRHDRPMPGKYGRFIRSGTFCLEYACIHGAEKVFLVGWDGYEQGYFDGRPRHHWEKENAIVNKLIVEISDAWADVEIVHVRP